MPGLKHTVTIAAPPEQVWTVLVDVERWPERIPTVDRVERLDAGPLAVGSRTRVEQPRLPTAVWTVTELADGSSYTWESRSPGVTVTAAHEVEPQPGREPAHPRRHRVRSAVRDRLDADAVAHPALRRDGGRLDQGVRRELDRVVEWPRADHSTGSTASAGSGMSSLCAVMNTTDTIRATANSTAPQKNATW